MLTFSKIRPFSAVNGLNIISLNIRNISTQFHYRAGAGYADIKFLLSLIDSTGRNHIILMKLENVPKFLSIDGLK